MLELEQAVEKILAELPTPKEEPVELHAAHGRYLSESIVARVDLPHFDNSSMDGYAVRAEDTTGAKRTNLVRLHVTGRVPAGSSSGGAVRQGECARIFTGSPIPAGSNAVVMQEDAATVRDDPDAIDILTEVAPGENVRRRGEDIARGREILVAGAKLTAGRLSLLAALGYEQVAVGCRPVVGVLATGSELREAGQELAPGQIYESNRLALSVLIRQAGAQANVFPLVRDSLPDTRAALQQAFETCDVLVTSGGVSVGEMDFVKQAFKENGGDLEFWKVAIKPGRPFVFGRMGQKLLFGLPGNPVSAFVTFLLLVRPALLRLQGAADCTLRSSFGVLDEELSNEGSRRHFVRVRVDTKGEIYSAGLQASHALSSLAAANGLVDMGPRTRLERGSPVKVLRWG